MSLLAIIGGSGLTQLPGLDIVNQLHLNTPWGMPSAPISAGRYKGADVLFLPRHGNPHTIPPHKINYQANIWALKEANVKQIIAVNAVGGITELMMPCRIVIPDQLIDYTHSRSDTYHEKDSGEVKHTDFTHPYSDVIRQKLIAAAKKNNISVCEKATNGVTQGPRLETAAEIKRLQRDGCDIVGMTSMPEASLARELELEYACCGLVVNWAAGKTDETISMNIIEHNLRQGMNKIQKIIASILNNEIKKP